MKINRVSQRKRTTVVLILLVVGIVAGAYYFYIKTPSDNTTKKSNTSSTINYNQASDDQKKAGESIKKTNVDASQSESPSPNPQAAGTSSSSKSEVAVTITSPDTENANVLTVNAYINKAVSTGTCTLKLTKPGSQTITQYTEVQAQASISACKGFTVSDATKGTWTATVSFENDMYVGTITKKITLQ
ncbi:MAG: hypothetical protein H6797_00100 [Candidatus Nomurabacteria bacterium]|nr:MAG: hypothetical protein H6797_00100 [Candidatus Nomurabacteria bacterium]